MASNRSDKEPLRQPALPPVADFSEDELLYARVAVAVARDPDASMFRGRLAESHVARLLGEDTEFAPLGVWPWDLRTADGIRLEVKTGARDFSIESGKGHEADVWVFLPTPDDTKTATWSAYFVAHPEFIAWARQRSKRLTLGTAIEHLPFAESAEDLRHIVGRVANGDDGLAPELDIAEPGSAEPGAEPIDHVSGDPELTAWRRSARAHQVRWRISHGWPAGEIARRTKQGTMTRVLANSLDAEFGPVSGANFLSDAIRDAVRHRLAHRQKGETLNTRRLHCNLLSSMPLCFNLFGQLHGDPERLSGATHAWFPELCRPGAPVELMVEWSPNRTSLDYTGDRTAFDAALVVGGPSPAVIGIETKYHEAPDRTRPPEPKSTYARLVEQTDMFASEDWRELVACSELEQIWRDHLLALSIGLHRDQPDAVRYVLVAPAGNSAWRRLADRYRELLSPDIRPTFEYRTVEDLLDVAAPWLADAPLFRERYLDVGQ